MTSNFSAWAAALSVWEYSRINWPRRWIILILMVSRRLAKRTGFRSSKLGQCSLVATEWCVCLDRLLYTLDMDEHHTVMPMHGRGCQACPFCCMRSQSCFTTQVCTLFRLHTDSYAHAHTRACTLGRRHQECGVHAPGYLGGRRSRPGYCGGTLTCILEIPLMIQMPMLRVLKR